MAHRQVAVPSSLSLSTHLEQLLQHQQRQQRPSLVLSMRMPAHLIGPIFRVAKCRSSNAQVLRWGSSSVQVTRCRQWAGALRLDKWLIPWQRRRTCRTKWACSCSQTKVVSHGSRAEVFREVAEHRRLGSAARNQPQAWVRRLQWERKAFNKASKAFSKAARAIREEGFRLLRRRALVAWVQACHSRVALLRTTSWHGQCKEFPTCG